MPDPPRTYLVVDEAPDRLPRHIDQVHPNTLRGLLAAMEEAGSAATGTTPSSSSRGRMRSPGFIRRFERGGETDVVGG